MTQYNLLPLADYESTSGTTSDYGSQQDSPKGATYAPQVDQDFIMETVPMFEEIIDLHDQEDSLSNISNSLQTSENEGETESSQQAGLSAAFTLDANAKRKRRSVRFCDKPPMECVALQKCEYDRTPHPVVIRLTYRDVLELREMKVELGIVTKRQVAAGGSAGSTLLNQNYKRNTSPTRPLSGGIFSAGSSPSDGNTSEQGSLTNGSDIDSAPASPACVTRASEFPSSSRLVSRLREMGEPQPPARESGMGINVEPTFGLDKAMNYESPPPSRGNTSRRLSRKTSGDFAVEESEFQKELRKARAELEMVAVQKVRERNIEDRDKIKSHGLSIISGLSAGPARPSTLQKTTGLELERKPSLSIFSNSYPAVGFPDKNAALYEPPSPTAPYGGVVTPTARAFSQSIYSPNASTPRAIKSTPFPSGYSLSTPTASLPAEAVAFEQERSPNSDSVMQSDVIVGSDPVSIVLDSAGLPSRRPTLTQQAKPGFKPPSPILAPFARSSTLLTLPKSTETSPPDAIPSATLTDPSNGSTKRPFGLRRESSDSRPIDRSTGTSTTPRKVLKPPSPILVPFARSVVQSIESITI
ncbi:hypothetical protein QFC19_003694 [Naganishia cerealis]|uniref:Uncharacterized protein n=1 Tax=Naganishia cerealis TaxID=610337 RepID=A0ACC2W339_9TREE|nr:hypothetical protein QFC19_003694 [Naganishia cerealis]